MSRPQLVIEEHISRTKLQTTIVDISFNNVDYLTAREPVYDMRGQKVSKSYYSLKGREAVRIKYLKIIGDYTHEDVVYENIFTGVQKVIEFIDWAKNVGYSKNMQPYYFNLIPTLDKDTGLIITGFSSMKQVEILRAERYKADAFLQGFNPALYDVIYDTYEAVYENYLKTGVKDDLVTAINNESNADVNFVLNKIVVGSTPEITVKQLIIMNLQ